VSVCVCGGGGAIGLTLTLNPKVGEPELVDENKRNGKTNATKRATDRV